MTFEVLTQYIPIFTHHHFGDWAKQSGNGTPENPFQWPHVRYSPEVRNFGRVVGTFVKEKYPMAINYQKVMATNGITEIEATDNAMIQQLNDQATIAMLIAIVRSERFCDGCLLHNLKNGRVVNLLKHLQQFDQGAGFYRH